jgi:excinuclease ABC subunit A
MSKSSNANVISIQGAKVHNLKNVSVTIPHTQLVVITGLSGSGKSSLAFDTLYAEGQRRYVESLSAYARQFLGRLNKPEVDNISGLSPAIAIQQKVNTTNTRSTVGTVTEIYDYLKLLYARIGRTYSPISGNEVKKHSVKDVMNFINFHPEDTKMMVWAKVILKEHLSLKENLAFFLQQGFSRIKIQDEIHLIEEVLSKSLKADFSEIKLLIDRIMVKKDDENQARIADSVELAMYEGKGVCIIEVVGKENQEQLFSNKFELDGMTFEEPSVHFFSFNNPMGACKTCEGFGKVMGIDEDLVIPNKELSVYEDAIVCWKGEKMSEWKTDFINQAHKFDFPLHKPYEQLNEKELDILWNGGKKLHGLNQFFEYLESKAYKIQYRVMLSRYRGRTTCPDCKGTRLRKDASYVKINGYSISDLVVMPIEECLAVIQGFKLETHEQIIAKRLLSEICSRLSFICDVGLSYLTLNRLSSSLSGGESQRINLANSLGSSLVGSMYILDEPSIGLHPKDTEKLIGVLKKLRDEGNTVIVVEHDEEIMKQADYLIDIGPEAGRHGGEIIFSGIPDEVKKVERSLTADYLLGKKEIEVPQHRRKVKEKITVLGAKHNNLKNIDVTFPLNMLTTVTGVSGSGKSTLVKNILYPALKKLKGDFVDKPGLYRAIEGDIDYIKNIEFIDQNPIGKSSRSNPVTYLKAYDEIRTIFSSQKLASTRGYKPKHFSFNVPGGRCETCEGEGYITVEMQFMADIKLLCDDCKGRRFKDEVLEVEYRGKNIYDVLQMTVDEALEFFSGDSSNLATKVVDKIKPLQDVGLGYVQLGQSSSTLSGGEAQRVKLAFFLSKGTSLGHTLFIFDEPTTGLHFHDVKKLLKSLEALIELGNSVVVIEHHSDVIKCADYVIDLGKEGGKKGGELIFSGTPEELVLHSESHTAEFIRDKLAVKSSKIS